MVQRPINDHKRIDQQRVVRGLANDSFNVRKANAGKTAHLERTEASLKQEERETRQKNGYKLTPADRKAISGQNRLSGNLYRKHNLAYR